MRNNIMSIYICIGIGLDQLMPEWVRVYNVDKNPIVNTVGPNYGKVTTTEWKNARSFVPKSRGKSRRRNA